MTAEERDRCESCDGRGRWRDSFTTFQGAHVEDVEVTCATCEGSGYVAEDDL